MNHFVARENIRHFTRQLGSETDPKRRLSVQRLLVEEEDRLGADVELLAEIKKTISNFNALIDTQSRFVAVLEKNGQRSASARALLDGLRQSKNICDRYYERILGSANNSRP